MNEIHPHTPRTAVPPVLVAQLLTAAALALFAAVAMAVLAGGTQGFDESLIVALRDVSDASRPIGPSWLEDVMRALTAMGTALTLTAVVLLGVGWFFFRGDRLSMGMLTLAGVGGFAINTGLKIVFDRPRPSVLPMLSDPDPWSFPSGHAMMTLVIFLALALLIGRSVKREKLRKALIACAVALSLLVGFSRMYLGVHYPSDVLGGWLLGLAWAGACWLIARTLELRRLNRTR